jgi:vanillate O-demethylase ferredoxin subunit
MLVQIAKIVDETPEIKSIYLHSVCGEMLPIFTPGSHIDVEISDGLVRQYSLCGDPAENEQYIIAVKKDLNSRGGSKYIHERFSVGQSLNISAPKNHFPLVSGGHHILIAGGIGVTPLLSMALYLANNKQSYSFHYFVSDESAIAFKDLINSPQLKRHSTIHTRVPRMQLDSEIESCLGDATLFIPTHIYTCGPEGFMDKVFEVSRKHLPNISYHSERFQGKSFVAAASEKTFEVILKKSNKSFQIPPNQTILNVLSSNGIPCPNSCNEGVCGTCLTGVLEGIPEHRDVYLNEEERTAGDEMCICVSRSLTKTLVLDM